MKNTTARPFITFAAILSAFLPISIYAQTLSLNDSSVLRSNTNRVGVNIGAIDYWDNGQILKNLIGSNDPGFEPLIDQQIWALAAAGTTTTFTVPDKWDTVPANYWAGGTFKVVETQSGGAELGCTGTIASNTGPNYPTSTAAWVDPTVTMSSGCAAPFSVGDVIVLSKRVFPTPESWWESGGLGGIWGSVSGGAQMLSDTNDLCPTCGTQALNLNATAAGSSATANWYFDSENTDNIFVMMNGTYELSFWAKVGSGTPTLTANAKRISSGGFNCGSFTSKLAGSWAQYTWTCSATETAGGTAPGNAQVSINVTGGSVLLDNVSFEKTGTDPNNDTVLRDEVIQTLQKFYGPSMANNPAAFRYWVNQNAETLDNWTNPDYAHGPTSSGTGYFVGPNGAGSENLSLEDYLVICKFLNAEPYLEVPVTFSTTDATNLIEFLAGTSGTPYGNRRVALGQGDPWTTVFSKIHLSFCNECWNNGSFIGQNLGYRATAPSNEYYYDYSSRARDIFAAMRASSSYTSAPFDLVMNAQTAVSWSVDTAIAKAHPDSIEIESYMYGSVSSFSTDSALWQPAMIDPYMKATNPADVRNFYQSVHDYQSQTTCGASGTSRCNVNIYEWGQDTLGGGIDQTHLDRINAGAGEGVAMALQPLLNIQYYGIGAQNFFSLTEYKQNGSLGPKLWGNVIDMGGATNNVRPTFLGPQLVNQSIIGPMYSCPISNNPTYNFAGSPNGFSPLPAMNNVPYLYAFCFMNGTQRSMVLINTDLTNSHTINFAGTNPPQGAVTQRQLAPSSLNDLNEAATGSATNQAAAAVSIETSSLSSPGSVTLPPYSVTALDYTAGGLSQAASPTFAPAAGTYTSSQSVTISDSTPGATIHYTTDGSTPTTSSATYSGAISVSGSETLQAIAVETGYANSPVASAAYTINTSLPAPTFSPAGGTYSSTQTVSISDTTPGTTIYYTTNGTTPTTSSTIYTGGISVSASQTIQAIAVKTGYSNSAVGTASYTISQGSLPVPTFSPAGGTYTMAQTVSISDSTTGTTIYYTTNGTSPTTASTKYTGAIMVSATETLKAIAVETGYSNSAVSSASYTISQGSLPLPTFSPAGGSYTTAQSVSIGDSTAGTTIYYTTNGTTPTTASGQYAGAITVSATQTLKAIAVETGYTNSAVASASYTISPGTLPAPSINPAGGVFNSAQSVSLGDSTTGTTIYYTTNGSTPTTSSAIYSGAITVSASLTLRAMAVKAGYNNSAVSSASFSISASSLLAGTLPPPSFSPTGGTYPTAQTVTSIAPMNGTTMYYTTDGSTPTTSSAKYTGPITVSASKTLKAIAVKRGYYNSPPAMAAYTIATGSSSGSLQYINYASGGFTVNNLSLNYGATVTGGYLQLTDGGSAEVRSAWSTTKVPVSSFKTDFNFRALYAVADGFTFTIQNDPKGIWALGNGGSGLGYQGIQRSVAVKFDIYDNAGEGPDSTGVFLNGALPTTPSTDLSSSGVDLASGDIIHAHVVYNGTTLTLTLTDTKTGANVTKQFAVNIPATVGATTAYVGFTGSTGKNTAVQQIMSWTFTN